MCMLLDDVVLQKKMFSNDLQSKVNLKMALHYLKIKCCVCVCICVQN